MCHVTKFTLRKFLQFVHFCLSLPLESPDASTSHDRTVQQEKRSKTDSSRTRIQTQNRKNCMWDERLSSRMRMRAVKVTIDAEITSRSCIPGCCLPFFPCPTCEAHHVAAFRTRDSRSADLDALSYPDRTVQPAHSNPKTTK
jgi:hypothetical protein